MEKFIRSVRSANSVDEVCCAFSNSILKLGYKAWVYVCYKDGKFIHYGNFSEQEIGEDVLTIENIEFIAKHAFEMTFPFVWKKLIEKIHIDKGLLPLKKSLLINLEKTIAIPIPVANDYVSITIVQDHCLFENELTDVDMHKLQTMSVLLHHYLEHGYDKSPEISLTPREEECMMWASVGKTSWEIGVILDIKERTVVYHIENVKKKLGVKTRQQAIAWVISRKLFVNHQA